MTKPVSRFMFILSLLNVTLIEIDWPMPCWRTLSGLHRLTFSKLKTRISVTSTSPGLHYQFQHEAWRHRIEHRYNQVVLQLANWLFGHSSCEWSKGQIFRAGRTKNAVTSGTIKILTWSPQIKEWAKSFPRKLLFRHDSLIVIPIWCVLDSLCGVHVNSLS